jgi:hypothetical protein
MGLLERCHFVQSVTATQQAAGEDMYNGNISSDVVSMENAQWATWVVQQLTGNTGNATIMIYACDNVTPSNTAQISFYYKRITSGDTPGATTETKTLVTTAGSNQLYVIEVKADKLAEQGYGYVQLICNEKTDDPVDGTVVGPILSGLRSAEDALATQLT